MVFVAFLFWVGLSLATGLWASNKGRSGFGWFCLAILISPLLAALFLAACRDLARDALENQRHFELIQATKTGAAPLSDAMSCPRCAETIKKAAKVCRFCGYEIPSQGGAMGQRLAEIREETFRSAEANQMTSTYGPDGDLTGKNRGEADEISVFGRPPRR